MKTKEVIKWLENGGGRFAELSKEYGYIDTNTIIECLQRGDKFEQIYEELEEDYRQLPFSVAGTHLHSMRIKKEKYFQRPKTEGEKIDDIIKSLEALKDLKGGKYNGSRKSNRIFKGVQPSVETVDKSK